MGASKAATLLLLLLFITEPTWIRSLKIPTNYYESASGIRNDDINTTYTIPETTITYGATTLKSSITTEMLTTTETTVEPTTGTVIESTITNKPTTVIPTTNGATTTKPTTTETLTTYETPTNEWSTSATMTSSEATTIINPTTQSTTNQPPTETTREPVTTESTATTKSITTTEFTTTESTTSIKPTTRTESTSTESPTTINPTTSQSTTTITPIFTTESTTFEPSTTTQSTTTIKLTTTSEPTTFEPTTTTQSTTSLKPTTTSEPTTTQSTTTIKLTTTSKPTTSVPTTTTQSITTIAPPTTTVATTFEPPTTTQSTTTIKLTTTSEPTTLVPTTTTQFITTIAPPVTTAATTFEPMTTTQSTTTIKLTTTSEPTTLVPTTTTQFITTIAPPVTTAATTFEPMTTTQSTTTIKLTTTSEPTTLVPTTTTPSITTIAPPITTEPTTTTQSTSIAPTTTTESTTLQPTTTIKPTTTTESTTLEPTTTIRPTTTIKPTTPTESTTLEPTTTITPTTTIKPTTTTESIITSTTSKPTTTTEIMTTTTELITTTEEPENHEPKPCIAVNYGQNSVVCVCNATYCDTIPRVQPIAEGEFELYSSDQAGRRFVKELGHFNPTIKEDPPIVGLIYINSNTKYQTITGFGGAFTDAAGININSLNNGAKNKLLRSYFSEDGIEYNLGRVPMGSTDFSTHPYTYDDGTADPELKNFKLAPEDLNIKIPLIKAAQALQSDLHLLGSAWAAPGWMKSNGAIGGPGLLKSTMYQTWANYVIKFLTAYKEQGLSFWGITTGNEPNKGREATQVPSLGWLAPQMGLWVATNLGPTLKNSQFSSTNIIAVDDKRKYFPNFIDLMFLGNPISKTFIDGFGVHWQDDDLTSINSLAETHKKYPDQIILSTDARAVSKTPVANGVELGRWDHAEEYIHSLIESLNNWATGWVDFNLALDEKGGPSFILNNNLEAAMIVNATGEEFYKQPVFYAQGYFSKFIPRGSQRIGVTQLFTKLEVTAFQRPDKGTVVVIYNQESIEQAVRINDIRRGHINIIAGPKTISTILYW